MQIKSIIIDRETKATRIDVNKVQLELSAFPLDEENNTEPGSELRLYINSQLLQTIKSDEEWKIKETLVINNNGSEQLLVKIEDVVQWIQSKIKCVMIEEKEKDHEEQQIGNKFNNIYELHKDIISPFKKINEYFQTATDTQNKFDETIEQKIMILSKIRRKLEEVKTIDLLSPHKQDLQKMIENYYENITIYEIDSEFKETTLKEIEYRKNELIIKSNKKEISNNEEHIKNTEEMIDFYKEQKREKPQEREYYSDKIDKEREYIKTLKNDNKELEEEIKQLINKNK